MAHGLNRGSVLQIHQALHGYADGHRLLACSTVLKPRDLKTMLIMSDASGPGASIDDTGYLTGYPLLDSGLYAFARTWAAKEVPRPGCVWTHTLLIDFGDLATLPAMDNLADSFRRPKETTLAEYESVLAIPEARSVPGTGLRTSEIRFVNPLRRLLWALYSHPKERVVASADEDSAVLIFCLWAQQWPRLRRSFRFCTLAFADRSSDAGAFDLQFVPAQERPIRSRFSALVDADRLEPGLEEWVDDALSDLLEGSKGNLRTFLRDTGSDVAGGRDAFVPLCQLHHLFNDFNDRSEAMDKAASLLDESFQTEYANSVRAAFVSAAANHPEGLEGRAITFVIRHLELLKDSDLEENGSRLGEVLWARDPGAFGKLLTDSPPRPVLAERTLVELSIDKLVEGLQRSPEIISDIIMRRPDLLEQTSFWEIPGSWHADAFIEAARNPNRVEGMIAAMIGARRGDLAADVARTFGSTQLLRAVATSAASNFGEIRTEDASAWLSSALSDAGVVAKALGDRLVKHRVMLLAIAHETKPDFVPNDFGEDPWWIASINAQGDLSDYGLQYLSAYLLARSLSRRSRNKAELIAYSFDTVYFAACRSRITNEAWSLIEPRLPWSFSWPDWDRCQRLRAAIADAFIYHDLSPLIYTQITHDEHVFSELVREVYRKGRAGRRFLRQVKQELLNANSDKARARMKILEEFV